MKKDEADYDSYDTKRKKIDNHCEEPPHTTGRKDPRERGIHIPGVSEVEEDG